MVNKRKFILIISIILVFIIVIAIFILFRTPTAIRKINNMEIYSVTVGKSCINSETHYEEDPKLDPYFITNKDSINEFVDLITAVNFKYYYEGSENISWSGDSITYHCYVESPQESVKIEILIVNNEMRVFLDHELVSFGLLGTLKFNEEKEDFIKNLTSIIEPYFVT